MVSEWELKEQSEATMKSKACNVAPPALEIPVYGSSRQAAIQHKRTRKPVCEGPTRKKV